MIIAVLLALLTGVATTLGGFIALRTKDRLHLVLGLSAGLLLGLVGFDLLPEVFSTNTSITLGVPSVSIAIVVGFFLLHLVEKSFATHEPHESDYGSDHDHRHVVGTLSAVAFIGHVFMDGVGIGAAFHVSHTLGYAVFLALLIHAFSDGLNTVAFLIKGGRWTAKAKLLLIADAIARTAGAALGSYVLISANGVALYLALFTGVIIYIATSHILPEAHANHPSRWTLVASVVGIAAMWIIKAHGA
jgi:ZIP family zinc transporter